MAIKNAYIYINKYNKIKNKIGEYKKDETKIIKSCYKSVQNVILYKNVNHVLFARTKQMLVDEIERQQTTATKKEKNTDGKEQCAEKQATNINEEQISVPTKAKKKKPSRIRYLSDSLLIRFHR